MPDAREHQPADGSWRKRFPDAVLARGMEAGAIIRADTAEGSWVILDEGTTAEFLPPEDHDLAGVTLERYATPELRDAIAWRLPRRR